MDQKSKSFVAFLLSNFNGLEIRSKKVKIFTHTDKQGENKTLFAFIGYKSAPKISAV